MCHDGTIAMLIYKYLHPDRIDLLENLHIRFTQPALFNDPFEMNPYISEIATEEEIDIHFDKNHDDTVKEEFSKLSRDIRRKLGYKKFTERYNKDVMRKRVKASAKGYGLVHARNSLKDAMSKSIGILCLTTKPDNLLMWAHYAESHTGIVIEFNSENEFFSPTFYREDKPDQIDEELMRDYGKLIEVEYQPNRPNVIVSQVKGFEQLLVKGCDWEYEDEWRMLMPTSKANRIVTDSSGNQVFLFSIPPTAISKVILGCRATDSLEQAVVSAIDSNPALSHIKVEKMDLHEQSFSLVHNSIK